MHASAAFSCLDRTMADAAILFTLQVALASLWRSWGIVPDGVQGEGLGEVAAAYIAGALTLEDAVRIVSHNLELAALQKDWEMPERLQLRPVTIPMYSATMGLTCEGQSLVASHWGKQFRRPDLSVAAVDQLLADGHDVFV